MDTQTQIDRLIELAIVQRAELKKLVSELPQLREHLNAEIERVFESTEPQLRTELEDWTTKQAKDQTAKLGGELEAKIAALSKSLEATTQTRYNAIMAERAQNIDLAKKAEDKLAEVAQAIPVQVKQIVTDELARFPRAGEIDQLRKEFAEPRGLNPRGRWQASETYNKLDLVSYNGDSYVSNTNGNREKPSRSSEAWTLSAARGNGGAGGGVTSLTDLVAVPANGELLIGNGSAFVNSTLTAGAGVTITNGPGTITIDASGAQELLTATVTNAESFAITRGQVVYLFGAVGNRASVKLADNSADATSAKTFGVVSDASIAANGIGLVTCVGVVDKLALGAYNDGDTLYLGNTPGAVTNVKPYAPNHLVYVGMVERANNGNGELYVKIQNGYELDEIHDVQITTPPLAGSLLMRDATTSLWKANRLTGTANQVTVTNADTSVTLSLPTAIANVNSVTAATTQNLTLAGGSTGASLVLGQGANASTVFTGTGTGLLSFTKATGNPEIRAIATPGGAGVFRAYTPSTSVLSVYGLYSVLEGNGNKWENGFYGTLDYVHRYNDSEKLRFTTTGNLLIGTTTDVGPRLLSKTKDNSYTGAGIGIVDQNSGTSYITRSGGTFYISNNGSTDHFTLSSTGAATFAGAVTTGGKVTFGSGTFAANTASAYVDATYGLAIVAKVGSSADLVITNTAGTPLFLNPTGTNNTVLNSILGGVTIGSTTAAPSLGLLVTGMVNMASTTSASSSTVGALTIGNGSAATNVAIGGGNINAGGTGTFAGAVNTNSINPSSGLLDVGATRLNVSTSGANARFTVNTYTSGDSSFDTLIDGTTKAGFAYLRSSSRAIIYGGGSSGNRALVIPDAGDVTLSSFGSQNLTIAPAANTVFSTGSVSIANTTPSTGAGSGALQVAGGIYAGAASVFGDAVTVSGADKTLTITSTASTPGFTMRQTGGIAANRNWGIVINNSANGDFILRRSTTTAGDPITPVLSFDSTGSATFAGAVSVARTATVGSVGGFDTDLILNASATTQATAISFQSSGTNNWKIGRGVATGGTELAIRNESLAANALTFTLANSAATFAGAVAINNTVATAVAVASTHKVTMVIGGVTYYLLASNV